MRHFPPLFILLCFAACAEEEDEICGYEVGYLQECEVSDEWQVPSITEGCVEFIAYCEFPYQCLSVDGQGICTETCGGYSDGECNRGYFQATCDTAQGVCVSP